MVRTPHSGRNNSYCIRIRNCTATNVVGTVRSLELDEWVEDPDDSDEYDAEDYYWLYEGLGLF